MRYILLTIIILFAAGCVNIEQANIKNSEINTAGWKSNAGGADQTIEATTSPTTTTGL